MDVFDVIGPDMIGPSSSHTAGAVRIGHAAVAVLDDKPKKARVGFYGSFAQTGKGHGTYEAMLGGILGFKTNDSRIKDSYKIAEKQGLEFEFYNAELNKSHPNTAIVELESANGNKIKIQASSIGGGVIIINKINGLEVNIPTDQTTLLIVNNDKPGVVSGVSNVLVQLNINVASMNLDRDKKGGTAIMSIQIDKPITKEQKQLFYEVPGVKKVNVLNVESI